MGANAGMEWSVDVWEVEKSLILGNGMAWRRRMLFSREAGDSDFSLQMVLI
jgi:hypothetical protein